MTSLMRGCLVACTLFIVGLCSADDNLCIPADDDLGSSASFAFFARGLRCLGGAFGSSFFFSAFGPRLRGCFADSPATAVCPRPALTVVDFCRVGDFERSG